MDIKDLEMLCWALLLPYVYLIPLPGVAWYPTCDYMIPHMWLHEVMWLLSHVGSLPCIDSGDQGGELTMWLYVSLGHFLSVFATGNDQILEVTSEWGYLPYHLVLISGKSTVAAYSTHWKPLAFLPPRLPPPISSSSYMRLLGYVRKVKEPPLLTQHSGSPTEMVRKSVSLSVCLPVRLSVCLPVCLSDSLPVCLSVCMSVAVHLCMGTMNLLCCDRAGGWGFT